MNGAHFEDLARRALRGPACFSRFLDPAQEALAQRAAREAGVECAFFGGYEGAERRLCAFYADEPPEDWPLDCLAIAWNGRYAQVAHRDLLGALMGLGIQRELTGDILVEGDGALAFCAREATAYLLANLESAGRAKIKVARHEGPVAPPKPQGQCLRATVSSLRLDAVLAAGLNLGRGEARSLVERALVKVNHRLEERPDAVLREGDLVSARGAGRLRLDAVQGQTKKGRIALTLFKFAR